MAAGNELTEQSLHLNKEKVPHMGSCRITVHSGAGSLILAWFWSRDNRLHYLQYGMRLLGASPSYVSNPLDWFLTMERPSWTDSSINSSGIKRRLQTSNSSWIGYEHRIAAKLVLKRSCCVGGYAGLGLSGFKSESPKTFKTYKNNSNLFSRHWPHLVLRDSMCRPGTPLHVPMAYAATGSLTNQCSNGNGQTMSGSQHALRGSPTRMCGNDKHCR